MKNISILCVIALMCSSCGDFLKEDSRNLAYVKTAAQIDEVLVGDVYASQYVVPFNDDNSSTLITCETADFFPWIHIMDDDAQECAYRAPNISQSVNSNGGYLRARLTGFHHWQQNPTLDYYSGVLSMDSWKGLYRHISVANSLMSTISEVDASDKEKNRLKGECLFLRAFYYWILVNTYALPYESDQTAATVEAIPLKLNEYVEPGYFQRQSLKTVYEQIISDLKESAQLLTGITQRLKFRATSSAAYALLSRVYLYQQKYQDAITYADLVLENSSYTLTDYNTTAEVPPLSASSPETIFTMGVNANAYYHPDDNIGIQAYKVSTSLRDTYGYDGADLRPARFFKLSTTNRVPLVRKQAVEGENPTGGIASDVFMIRLSEVILNKAEAQALLKEPNAAATLQLLRRCRIQTAKLNDINLTGDQLVAYIRDERRRELCYEGHRWFDLRRYAVNQIFPQSQTIRHEYWEGNGDILNNRYEFKGYYDLLPYDQDREARVLPIPTYEIIYNKGELLSMPNGMERKIRSLIN